MTSREAFRSTASNPIARWLVGADRRLEVSDRGMTISVNSAVRRHSWIAFGPQLTQDDSLGYPPRSEQQATRLEDNLAARSHSTSHDRNPPTGERTVICRVEALEELRLNAACRRRAFIRKPMSGRRDMTSPSNRLLACRPVNGSS
jgi:hypothetical protein